MRFTLLRSPLALQAGASFGIRIANLCLGLAVAVLLARLLGVEGYGRYAFVLSLLMLLAIPVEMGLPTLVVRETAKAGHAGDWPVMRGLWLWSHRCVLAVSLTFLAGALAWFMLLDRDSEWRLLVLTGTLLVPVIALGNIRGAALRGLGRVVLGQTPEFVLRPLFLAILLIAVSGLAGGALSPEIAMGLHVAAALAAFAIGTVMLLRAAPADVRRGARRIEGLAWAAAAIPLGMISGLHVVHSNIDVVMLGTLRVAEEVGVYKVAVTAAGLVSMGLQSVNMLIMPRIVTAHAAGDQARLQRLVTASARLALAFALPAVLVFLVAGGWLLETAFGSEYRAGYPVLAVVALGQLANAGFGSVGVLLNMTGHERDTLAAVALAAAVNVILNLALIPAYGGLGAALATVATLVAWNVLLCWRVWTRLGINSTALRRKRGWWGA